MHFPAKLHFASVELRYDVESARQLKPHPAMELPGQWRSPMEFWNEMASRLFPEFLSSRYS